MRYQLNKFVIQLLRRDGDCGQMHEVACACLIKMILLESMERGHIRTFPCISTYRLVQKKGPVC